MTTTVRYIPRGYITTEAAFLKIAKTRNPERWASALLHPKEADVYASLGTALRGEFLKEHIWARIPARERQKVEGLVDRYCDYQEARTEVRRSLHVGEMTAKFVDENGKFGRFVQDVWGSDGAECFLQNGVAHVEYSPTLTVSRLILLSTAEVENLAKSLLPADQEKDVRPRNQAAASIDLDAADKKTNKGGRPPEFDWAAIKAYSDGLVKKHGAPGRRNPKLPTQEDLVTAILEDMAGRDLHPSRSNIRRRVSMWLEGIE